MKPESRGAGRWETLHRAMRFSAGALAAVFVLLFFYVACARMRYPFELEKIESGMLTSTWRVAHRMPLYSAPSMEWVPFLYAPVFFFVSAAAMKFTGAAYAATRLVSTLSTAGAFAAIFLFVYLERGRDRRSVLPAVVATGLYASLYSVLGGWFDIGRVDSLTLLLLMIALLLTRFTHPAVAAVAWVAVVMTKQSFLPLVPVLLLFEWPRPRRMLTGMGVYAALLGLVVMWGQRATDGWFGFYVLGTPAQLHMVWRDFVLYLPGDLAMLVGVALLLIVIAVVLPRLHTDERLRTEISSSVHLRFYAVGSAAMYGSTWYVRSHTGASTNALLPMYAWTAVLFGLAVDALSKRAVQMGDARTRCATAALLWLAVAVQLGMHMYNPGRLLPTEDWLRHRQQLVEAVRHEPGEVWALEHSWDGVLAGKGTHAELDSLDAVLTRPMTARTAPFRADLERALAERRFAALLTDRDPGDYLPELGLRGAAFREAYPIKAVAPGGDQRPLINQPQFVLLPCAGAAGDPWQLRTALHTSGPCAGMH